MPFPYSYSLNCACACTPPTHHRHTIIPHTQSIHTHKPHAHTHHIDTTHHTNIQSSVSSVAQSCLTLCDPMDYSMPGLPVHHKLLESIQTHVHWVGNAIQPSHPLLSPSPPALNLSQHQGFSNESALSSSGQSVGSSASASNEYSGLSSFRINW